MISRHQRILFVFLALAAAAVACDKLPLLAPTGSKIALFADNTTVPANGTAQVTATILEASGTPVQNGTLISFTTTLGRISPPDARTNNGKVTVMFSGDGQSGEALIQANSGGATPPTTALSIKVGAGAADSVSLSASPATVPVTGGIVTLLATVRGVNSQGLPGVLVTFSASAGSLSSSVATTDATGVASVTLQTTQQATVTARAGTKDSAAVTVAIRAGNSLTVTATPSSATAPAAVAITVAPSAAGSFVRDVHVDYGDGSGDDMGTITGSVSRSHFYERPGTFIVRASGIDVTGDVVVGSTSVTMLAPVTGLTVSASPNPTTFPVTTTTITVTPTGGTMKNVVLDFGDGTNPVNFGTISSATTVPHQYPAARQNYTVTATGVDTVGNNVSGRTVFLVQ